MNTFKLMLVGALATSAFLMSNDASALRAARIAATAGSANDPNGCWVKGSKGDVTYRSLAPCLTTGEWIFSIPTEENASASLITAYVVTQSTYVTMTLSTYSWDGQLASSSNSVTPTFSTAGQTQLGPIFLPYGGYAVIKTSAQNNGRILNYAYAYDY